MYRSLSLCLFGAVGWGSLLVAAFVVLPELDEH
jgi:hypothetical protein